MMQPPTVIPHVDDAMIDDALENADTQQTQSTQQASQPILGVDGHLWGYLQPCNAELSRIDFWKGVPSYSIGRNPESNVNDIILKGFKVSGKHCIITWDGSDDRVSTITVQDLSSNGTYLNGEKIGKGKTRILQEGNEIAFGTCQPQANHHEDYRYIYRHTAAGPPSEGLHAFYDIATELGKGSFASVVKAMHRETGEWYAVKMIQLNKLKATNGTAPQTDPKDPKKGNAFAREISILETLRHPNICQLKEVFFDKANINLVLELVQGGDLLDFILNRGGLGENLARTARAHPQELNRISGIEEPVTQHITFQMCDAMAYIHSKGIAHRDLKPENVLLTKDDPPVVKVADFGLAKCVDSLTMLRTMCGTPSYLAPEVVLQTNHEGYDQLVDSWSVGVIVFSMLANVNPFIEDENQKDIRTRIAERKIDWTALQEKNVSNEGRDFVVQLLEHDPRERMTLNAARYHPWLSAQPTPADYTQGQPRVVTASPSIESLPAEASMLSAIQEDDAGYQNVPFVDDVSIQHFEHMNLGHHEAPPSSSLNPAATGASSNSPINGNGREGSRAAPLQRRSHVLSQAAEGDVEILQPSDDMVNSTASQGANKVDGPSDNGARGNKRVRSELTPLPEDNERGPLANSNSPRKKGKPEDDDMSVSPAPPRKALRGNEGRSMRTRAAALVASEDEKPRRSTRQTPQKVARRT